MKRLIRLSMLALLCLPLPALAQTTDAQDISEAVFGPRLPVDHAFGAFQRGYFLTAMALALPRAEEGDDAAQTLIAELYAKGLGLAQNLERAAGWYRLAASNGSTLAKFELAMLYQEGAGVPRDRTEAARLFREAADDGYIPARYNLALLHVEGVYAEPSLKKAAELMREAAEAEYAEAQYDYGSMLIEGAGVVPDQTEGVRYIGLAAEQGLADAQIDYATALYLGTGVERDLEAAVAWYHRAAETGNPVAQNRYAKLLAVGEGVTLNLEDAAMWRALARRQGLSDQALDRLLVSIPTENLAKAEERARFWPSEPPGVVANAPEVQIELSPFLPSPVAPENAPSEAKGVSSRIVDEAPAPANPDADPGAAGAEAPQDP